MTNVLDGKILDGKAAAAEIRAEVAAGVRELLAVGARPPQLVAVLVGDDPASQAYVGSKVQGLRRGRHAQPHPPARRRDLRGRAPRPARRAQRRRRGRRHPGAAPAPQADHREARPRPRRSRQGRRRLPPGQRRPPLARRGGAHPGDPHRHRRPAEAQRHPPRRPPGGDRRAQRHRRQADGGPAAAGELHGHHLPLPHRRSRRRHPRGRHPGRRHRPAGDDRARPRPRGGGGGGRRHEPPGRRRRGRAPLPRRRGAPPAVRIQGVHPGGRCRLHPRGAEGVPHHPGPRRCRAADRRHGHRRHPEGFPAPAGSPPS